MKDKIIKFLTKIWAVASFVLLFGGGITFFGYFAAVIIGGDAGASIISFLYSKVFSVLIYVNSVFIIIGLVKMELSGEKALTASGNKRKKKTEKEN